MSLLHWRSRRPGAIAERLEAEGFARHDPADFMPHTRGSHGGCNRQHYLRGESGKNIAAWQIHTASGALYAYCEPCAWDLMVTRRAKRLRDLKAAHAEETNEEFVERIRPEHQRMADEREDRQGRPPERSG